MKRVLNFQNFQNSLINESTNSAMDIYQKLNEQELTIEEAIGKLDRLIDRDFKEYLKKKMWNKSKEVYYGKNYTGSPDKDQRQLIVGDWFEAHDKATMGEFFLDSWAETDQFCDRTVEWVQTGELGDFWKDALVVTGWAGVFALGVAATIATGGLVWGAVQGGAAIGSAIALSTTVSTTIINTSAIAGLSWGVAKAIYEDPKTDSMEKRIAELVLNRDTTIANLKSALERHTDFEKDWGLDRWLPAIQGMPGWSSGPWKNIDAEKIGYAYTYTISFYTMKFLEEKIGAIGAKELIKAEQKKKEEQPKPQAQQTTTQPTATTTKPATTQVAKTEPQEVSGVMGTVTKEKFVVDDEVLANYGL